MSINYQISDFITLEQFEQLNKDDTFLQKKYFLLIMQKNEFKELISCHIYTTEPLQLIPIEDEVSDNPHIYDINEMKRAMKCEWGNGIEYFIGLQENERIVRK